MPYVTNEDLVGIDCAVTFEELREIACTILSRMPWPVGIVCGPLTSGGFGSFELNRREMQRAIRKLNDEDKGVFNQLIFEDAMHRIMKNKSYYKGGNHLLETFYLPILERYIRKMYFLQGWKGSQGATWEHQTGLRLGIEIIYL